MNLAAVARILSRFVLYFALAQVVPLAVAWFETPHPDIDGVTGFAVSTGVGIVVALFLGLAGRGKHPDFFRREGLAVVGLAWIAASSLGALPFLWSGALSRPADAVFETVSGLTTTGASVFGASETPPVADLPRSILLWRGILHWLGGMGIILVFVVLLPAMGLTGKNLLASEQTGFADDSQVPRLQEQSRSLFLFYVALTVANIGLLWVAGMRDLFEATCHAFATVSTGGFSTRNLSIGEYRSLPIELVTTAFMWISGANFLIWVAFVRSGLRDRSVFRNAELRGYVVVTLVIVVAVATILRVWGAVVPDPAAGSKAYNDILTCLRDAAFNVVSVLTETGFATADFQGWPMPAVVLLTFCMLIGGCTGSTSGGLKVLRFVVCARLVNYTARHFLRPKSIEKIKVDEYVVPNSVVSAVLALVLMWFTALGIGTFVMSLDARLDLQSCLTATATMLGCCGPSLSDMRAGTVNLGPYGSYGDLTQPVMLVMSFEMLLGRLEILAPLMLFMPGLWRR